jgi:hypothetical protein
VPKYQRIKPSYPPKSGPTSNSSGWENVPYLRNGGAVHDACQKYMSILVDGIAHPVSSLASLIGRRDAR